MKKILTTKSFTSEIAFLIYYALFKLLLHLNTNLFAGYGYFRDELYYIACSEHLSAGYVDQPPFSLFILAINRFIFGDSIFALRLLPALCGAGSIFLAGYIARELGGKKLAQAFAAVGAIAAPIFFAGTATYSMNAFDMLFWGLSYLLLIKLIKTGSGKFWIYLGLVLGFGLLNKIGVLWLGAGIFVGIILSEHRVWLKRKEPYVAAGIALILFLPYVIWNLQHDLAHLEFIRNATGMKYTSQTPLVFLIGQLLILNPVAVPLWFGGLFYLFFNKEMHRFRLLPCIYITALMILVVNGHSKPEYLAAAYPILFAGGGVAIEKWFGEKRKWLAFSYLGLLGMSGLIFAPFTLPILPVETFIRYQDALGLAPTTAEGKQLEKLPQFYADMFGWQEKAEAVAKVYQSLSPEERSDCAIYASNYGRCASIDFFGLRYGLPKTIGSHNNYWIWGPRNYSGKLMIIIQRNIGDLQSNFESVILAGTVSSQHCMPYENNLQIFICRNIRKPLQKVWPQLKNYE